MTKVWVVETYYQIEYAAAAWVLAGVFSSEAEAKELADRIPTGTRTLDTRTRSVELGTLLEGPW